jgi:transposase
MDKDALIISLQRTVETQAQQLAQQTILLEKLNQRVEDLLRKLYGKKSEKVPPPADAPLPEVTTPPETQQHSDKKSHEPAKRSRLPKDLECVEVIHDLADKDKSCQHCQQPLHRMGQRVTEQVDFVPAQLIVKRHVCYKYACRCGLGGVRCAVMPNQPIEKGLPGAGLLAEVLVSKYQDALPLYRQMLRFRRLGYECSDSTLGDWVRDCSFLLEPLVVAMRRDLLRAQKLHTDDTPVPVLAKGKTKQARLWVYLADHHAPHAICIYDYTPTRSSLGPQTFLNGYRGYLQADAYNGYDCLYTSKQIIEVGCFAHARRKFFEVAEAAKGPSHARDIVDAIGELYGIETESEHFSPYERYYYRKKFSKPKLKQLHRKIKKLFTRATPNTPFYSALQYALNQWIALTRYLADGMLDIDNNAAERAIKPLVIGRKNWLFAGSHEGGKRSAIIYSIIETCKMNNINPFEYLTDVLSRIPNTLQQNIQLLLPYHWQKYPSI